VNAYRLVKKHHDVRLVSPGPPGRAGQPEILGELRETAQAIRTSRARAATDARSRSTRCSARHHRAAEVVRESFAWVPPSDVEGQPVIGGSSAAAQQIVYDVTGYVVSSVEARPSACATC